MENTKLARQIARAISNGSKYYHAKVSKQPRIYLKMSGDRKSVYLRNGIVIERYYDVFWIKSRLFVFIPEIERYIRRLARKDKDFAARADSNSFSPDDLERMIFFISHGNIKLRMRGRKIYDYENISE